MEQTPETISDLENRGRRKNIRIVGVPENTEGRDMKSFLNSLLRKCLGLDIDNMFEIKRAHRSLGPKPSSEGRPLQIMCKGDRATGGLREGGVEWQKNRVFFFQDLSQDVMLRCKKFDEVKRSLQEKGIRYTMLYPAIMKVSVNGTQHRFSSVADIRSFLSTLPE
ncbi:UNVERIFIED_CONTAM: hypothetical protein FKN15_073935 [Acipenser sinensis]